MEYLAIKMVVMKNYLTCRNTEAKKGKNSGCNCICTALS